MTEVGAIEINGFKKLTGMNDNEFKRCSVLKVEQNNLQADFNVYYKTIHDEKYV